MKFKIPFTFSDIEKLKSRSSFFSSKIRHKKDSKLASYLRSCNVNLEREEYIGICLRNFLISFVFLFMISTTIFALLFVENFYVFGILFSLIFAGFIFFSQMIYPRIYVTRKQRDIERNLINALEDFLIQLNAGVSIFNTLTHISSADYGFLSVEFKKVVKRISAGEPEPEVLNSIGKDNPSVLFRRTLWQISNGMIAGSDMAVVVRDTIKALNEEQLIQIQNYGAQLNPMIVMYMLLTVIIPTLSIAFLTILSSMVSLPQNSTYLLFIALFVFVMLAQIMFLGIIKSKRPRLL